MVERKTFYSRNAFLVILKSLNAKKTSSTDKILTKLAKLASDFLSGTLAIAINNFIFTLSKFLNIATVAIVVPTDKKRDDKYDVSNF